MTVTELQELFKLQLDAGAKKVFYMTIQGGPDMHQMTGSILKHDTETASFDDLLASLNGYAFEELVGNAKWPRFRKAQA